MTDPPPPAEWGFPTAIRFGAGRIRELPRACRELGMTRPLIVTDPGLAGFPMIRRAREANEAAGLATAVHGDIHPNPPARDVAGGLARLREGGHDGIVAFGGGSAMDVGKAVAFMAGQSRPLWDFEERAGGPAGADAAGILPVVAVPTTSGTGSEVGRAAVLIDEDERRKKIVFHPRMLPSIAIVDPELTLGLPPSITAWTGMDALAHCLEAYGAAGHHPMADGIALEGMRLIGAWLPAAVADGGNLAARGHMQIAAGMGATAFQKGLGAIHALSNPIGALFGTHHGRTNAVVMPYVMAFNRAAVAERYGALARYLDLPKPGFDGVLDWVLELRAALGIEHGLAGIGVDDGCTEALVEQALADPTAAGNPVPLDARSLRGLFLQALEGRLVRA